MIRDEDIDYPVAWPWSPGAFAVERERYLFGQQHQCEDRINRLEEQISQMQRMTESLMARYESYGERRRMPQAPPPPPRKEPTRGEDTSEGNPWSQFQPGGDTARAEP